MSWRSLLRYTSRRLVQRLNPAACRLRTQLRGPLLSGAARSMSLAGGTRLDGGSDILHAPVAPLRARGAFTSTKGRGTTTRGTVTKAGSSFCVPPGFRLAVELTPPDIGRRSPLRASSYTARGWYTGETATPGGNGAPQGHAA